MKSPTATKNSPGKAKDKTNTAANSQADVAFRAATSARCIKTGKSIAQKGNAVKETKKNKQTDQGASKIGKQLEAGKSSSRKKAAVQCKVMFSSARLEEARHADS